MIRAYNLYMKFVNMRNPLLGVILIILSSQIFSTALAQQTNIDSLSQLLSETNESSMQAELLIEIANLFQQTNPDTLVELALEALTISERINDNEMIIRSGLLAAQGMIRSGSYDKSLEQFQSTLEFLEDLNSSDFESYRGHALRGIGNIYFIQFQQELSLEYYNEVLPILIALEDSTTIAKLYDNMASAYLELEDKNLAEEYYLKSLAINEATNDVMGAAATDINLAILYSTSEQLDKAVYHATKALNVARQRDAMIMESYAVRILGSVAFDLKDFELALEYNQRSLQIANELDIAYEQKDSYKNLSDIYREMGRFEEAYENYVIHKQYNDSLLNQESQLKLAELRAEYETEQKEQQILLLEKESELKSARLISISLALSSVLIVVVIGSISFASRKRKEIELLEKNKIIADSKKRIAEEELANAQLREENLQKELTNYALHIVEKNDFLEEVKTEMTDLRSEVKNQDALKQINKLGSKIYQNLMINKDREEFEIQVEQACDGFFKSLEQRYPALTNQERRLAALLRLNLSSKEISGILNISPKSVDQSRYRLRKKLDLPKSENLGVFLNLI